jgi:seryl-tRNA synthetase
VALPQRRSTNAGDLKKLDTLSDQLDTAKDASEATTKEVQRARLTTENVKRDVRRRQHTDDTIRKRKPAKDRYTADGKSKAAVELGRKGGTARAKTLTRQQRSALAVKAAKTRWERR